MNKRLNINVLVGKTLKAIEVSKHLEDVTFTTTCGEEYLMNHIQDCCEEVVIEEITGDTNDLVGSPILQAEESSNHDGGDRFGDSITWTFYRITTMKGQVVLRWSGRSNGYYSESVDFRRVWPAQYLHVRDCKGGEEWIIPLRGNAKLCLDTRVRQWIRDTFAGELRMDGEITPKLEGDYYAQIKMNGEAPDSVTSWESGGFFLKSAE